jgi:ABC-2 type transport system ATP-binding protein
MAAAEPQGSSSIELAGVRVERRGRTVLDAIDLRLDRGTCVVVGGNGAGKSSLLDVMAGLLEPAAGRVEIDGLDLSLRGRRRPSVGLLPQHATFPERCTVAEAITYAAWLQRVPAPRSAAVDRALAAVDLVAERQVPLGRLSGGMRQRAHLAQALVHDPSVLLLDEPTAALDLVHAAALRDLLESLASTRCVVVTTHLVDDVAQLGGRVLVLRSGAIDFDGPADELLERSGQPSLSEALTDALRAGAPC